MASKRLRNAREHGGFSVFHGVDNHKGVQWKIRMNR